MIQNDRDNREQYVLLEGANQLQLSREYGLAGDYNSINRVSDTNTAQVFKIGEMVKNDLLISKDMPEVEVETELRLPDGKMESRRSSWFSFF